VLVVLSSLATLLGSLLAVRLAPLKPGSLAHLLAGVGGFLLASAFLDLIPHVAEEQGPQWLPLVLVGYLLLLGVESLLPTRAHPEGVLPGGASRGWPHAGPPAPGGSASFWGALLGLSAHAFFDGVALMGGLGAGLARGLPLVLAISLHKIPEGFTLGALGCQALGQPRLAAWSGGLLTLATLVGAWVTLVLERVAWALESALLPLAAGALIYIGATEMVPAVHHERGFSGGAAALAGALLFYLSALAARGLGLE